MKNTLSIFLQEIRASVQGLIEHVWSMYRAAEKENSETISRTKKLILTVNQECVALYGKWLQVGMSSIFLEQFQQIFLCSCCSWTLSFRALAKSFQCFRNPAQSKYPWIGLDEAEVANINDFHWWKELMGWPGLLNLLEGASFKISHPKNIFETELHIFLSNTVPIFATGICLLNYVWTYGLKDEWETAMMDSRWRIFEFSHHTKNNDIQEIHACPKCFHDLVSWVHLTNWNSLSTNKKVIRTLHQTVSDLLQKCNMLASC